MGWWNNSSLAPLNPLNPLNPMIGMVTMLGCDRVQLEFKVNMIRRGTHNSRLYYS